MNPYANESGDSGVIAYEIHPTLIRVQFRNRQIYRYTHDRVGSDNVETMKALATSGKGLSTFISRNREVREGGERE